MALLEETGPARREVPASGHAPGELADALARIQAGKDLPPGLAAAWVRSHDAGLDEDLARAAMRVTQRRFGRTVRLFAPLYVSNVCVNNCLYCGFRRENRNVPRRVLTEVEVGREARQLLAMGHRRVLMVASENPSAPGRRLLVGAARRIRSAGVEHLGVEVAPAGGSFFQELANAGVDSYVLFQETYDREIYARVHPDGPKRDYDARLAAPERALAAGIPDVGLGVLLGLRDPAEEITDLITHARAIEASSGHPPRTVSLPRLRPAAGSELSQHPLRPVGDEELLRMIAVLRLALPGTGIILSSRESPALRDRALARGVTEMSAGSRTDPGGYSEPDRPSLAQFDVTDRRSLEEVAASLRERGWIPCVAGRDVPSAPATA